MIIILNLILGTVAITANSFQCHDGNCISSENLCDGKADCTDKSDETELECSQFVCSGYYFRCKYGGCVDANAACNGIKDCIDNSDETSPNCNLSTHINTSPYFNCSNEQFRCNDGQCIDSTAICDGTIDCNDRSDETYKTCKSFSCTESVAFHCTYGACIDGDLKCNGIANCVDGSDEDPQLCERHTTSQRPYWGSFTSTTKPIRTTTTIYKPPYTTSTRRSTTSQVVPSVLGIRTPCQVPPQPPNGNWKLHRSQCSSGRDCNIQRDVTTLDPGTYLVYSCDQGFRSNGSTDVFCGPQGQWLNIPQCLEIHCEALSSASTEATCTYNDGWISCENSVPVRTSAKLSCRNSYRQDTTFLSTQRDTVRCNDDGEWEPEPIRCVSVCGVTAPKNTPLIVNGSIAKIADFPWHATLYRSESSHAPKEFICGATIIQTDLLITAAHCVYNEQRRKIDNPEKYYIATGNIFRDYDSLNHDLRIVKKSKVKNIFVNCNYLGLEGNYARDIAILQIKEPFVFSSLVTPICLDTTSSNDQLILEEGNFGQVAGFGRTATGSSSYILQTITVPYVSFNRCKSAALESEKFITIDKFCAGYSNGSSVCDGDSGGGLVFKTGGLWYLRGIVSVGIGATVLGVSRVCDSFSYSLYTRISSHTQWIQDIVLNLETNKPIPPCHNFF